MCVYAGAYVDVHDDVGVDVCRCVYVYVDADMYVDVIVVCT